MTEQYNITKDHRPSTVGTARFARIYAEGRYVDMFSDEYEKAMTSLGEWHLGMLAVAIARPEEGASVRSEPYLEGTGARRVIWSRPKKPTLTLILSGPQWSSVKGASLD